MYIYIYVYICIYTHVFLFSGLLLPRRLVFGKTSGAVHQQKHRCDFHIECQWWGGAFSSVEHISFLRYTQEKINFLKSTQKKVITFARCVVSQSDTTGKTRKGTFHSRKTTKTHGDTFRTAGKQQRRTGRRSALQENSKDAREDAPRCKKTAKTHGKTLRAARKQQRRCFLKRNKNYFLFFKKTASLLLSCSAERLPVRLCSFPAVRSVSPRVFAVFPQRGACFRRYKD